MIRIFHFALAIGAVTTFGAQARAQDRCSDVLQGGTFSSFVARDDWYSHQVQWAQSRTSSASSASGQTHGSALIPEAGTVVSGGVSRQRSRRNEQEAQYFGSLDEGRQVDIAVMSGDRGVLGAWQGCMRNRGGLAIRFSTGAARIVTVELQYFARLGVDEITVAEGPYLPAGVRIVQGADCLRPGRTFRHEERCAATLQVDNDHISFPVSVNTRQGISGEAWLPKRIRLQTSPPRNFVFRADQTIGREYRKTGRLNDTLTATLTDAQMAEGWYFVPSSAGVTYAQRHIRRATCEPLPPVVDDYSFTYGVRANAPNNGSRSGVVWCGVTPRIMIRRDSWVGINGDEDPARGAATDEPTGETQNQQ